MDFDQLRRDLQWLRGEDGVVPAAEAVKVLSRLLAPLLAAEGLELFEPESPGLGVDLFAASRADDDEGARYRASVAIEYKHHGGGRPLGIDAIDQLIANMGKTPYERAMLVGRFGFTEAAAEAARSREPVDIELLDLAGIDAWIRRLEIGKPGYAEQVQVLIKSISHEFARLVSETPDTLDHLEWRDFERMVVRVLEGLGFECELTPPSKDGGKDLILVWRATSGDKSFIVELKHWRSGKRVGRVAVADFMSVIVEENRTGGLFLSTSGYAADRIEGLTEVARDRLWFGGKSKVVLLAKTYMRACNGLWSPPTILPEVLFEATEPAPHGSLNWNSFRHDPSLLAEYPHWRPIGPGSTLSFDSANPLANPDLQEINADMRYCLYPGDPDLPTSHADIARLWHDAVASIRASDSIVFVGYSLPEYDSFASDLFRRECANKKVEVFDPSSAVQEKFRTAFPAAAITACTFNQSSYARRPDAG